MIILQPKTLILLILVFLGINLNSQNIISVRKASYFDKTPPLRSMRVIQPWERNRSWKDGVIRNEEDGRERNENQNPLPIGPDPVLQDNFGWQRGNQPFINIEGIGNRNSVYPPDTEGDVGLDYYIQMINLSFQIFDKEGNSLYGPADNNSLWQGFIGPWTTTNDGDPIILYDEVADRWVASQFAINTPDNTYWELVAISETGDPLGSWFRYAFQFPVFNDYPKMGIWSDAYYFSFNMFGQDYRRVAAAAMEREAMLSGDSTARMILFDLPDGSAPWSMLPADIDGPAPPDGAPNYFIYAMDDAFGSGDYLSIWEFKADWQQPENSTFQEVTRLDVEPFDSRLCDAPRGRCVHQPDNAPQLESLSDRLMFRLQYRNFGSYQTMVTNHTVDVDGNGHAGIRWYELRNMNDGNGWLIYQQGTYAPDGDHRWMGSIAMDGRGYIALGFSVSSLNTYPSIRYTGRSPNSPLGQMTFYEEEIMPGSGIQSGDACRWGDYSMMSVDPSNDTSFWYTNEYVEQSGQVKWQTRIAGFTLTEDLIPPSDVTDLTAIAATTNAIDLSWTASGDDGNTGAAFLNDIRYSTTPITEENFSSALQAQNVPDPKNPGEQETYRLNGLEYNTLYYLALKVRDRQFNFSGLSNVAFATTPGPPEITPVENALTQKLFPTAVAERDFIIKNTGQSDIYLDIVKDTLSQSRRQHIPGLYADETRIPDPKTEREFSELSVNTSVTGGRAFGEILGTYGNGINANTGMVWVDNILFVIDMQEGKLMRYDTALQEVTSTVMIHPTPYGMTWDGEYLWIGTKVGNVYAYDLDGNPAGGSFSCPFAGYPSLTWDGSSFLVNFILENDPIIYRVDETGSIIGKFYTDIDNRTIWQAVWVPEHYMGNLWFTNNSGIIGQIRFEENSGIIVNQFDAPADVAYALTHDHTDLYYGKTGGIIYRIDDGIDEVNWLKVSPDNAAIPAAGETVIKLTFNTGELDYGAHHANLVISSNDQDEPVIRVPVDLLITSIDLGQDTSFCGHLAVLLDAGEGFNGYLWSDGSQGQTLLADSLTFGIGEELIWVEVTDLGGIKDKDSVSVNFLDCAGIVELGNDLKIALYPNPSKGIIELMIEGEESRLEIIVTDVTGKVVFHDTVIWIPGNGKHHHINLSGQSRGSYFVKLSDGKTASVKQIIIEH